MTQIQINHETRLVQGDVLDASRGPLLASLRRYDPQLYLKWRPGKRGEKGVWELRRYPEFKTVREGYYIEAPNKGKVYVPGDIFEYEGVTLVYPKYRETSADRIKTFERLDYRILDWVAKQDLWQYGYKGRDFATESAYKEAKFEEKIDEESDAEKQYGLRQMRTQIQDFREYVLAGGNPYRLVDYWK